MEGTMNTQTTSNLSNHKLHRSDGAYFNVIWDETNNTIHMIEQAPKGHPMEMIDFEQTRKVKITNV